MVDFPVIIQLGFQQFKSYDNVKLPQIQFFDIATGGVRTVQPVQKTAVRGKVVDTPVDASTTGAMVQTVQAAGSPAPGMAPSREDGGCRGAGDALHHSAQPAGPEVEEQEKNEASRRQKAPPPGARPGILAEPGPQRSDRSLRHSSGNAPLLVVATLAAAAADGVDAAALAFLTARALEARRKEGRRRGRKRKSRKRRRRRRRRRSVVFLAGSSCFQMLRVR